jgi:hypothetical protein
MLASSPTGLAESGSLSLRTGHSPQVAPHPFSRKRNYHCWIQAGNGGPEGTSTLLFKRLHRRTSHHRSCVMWLRREPNNRSKSTHLKSFSATQRQSPSESENFPVLIQPNFCLIFCPIFSVRNCPRMMIRICWRRTQNDQSPVTKPHHTEKLSFSHLTNNFRSLSLFPLVKGRQARA